jgi:hypothetical protein
VSTYEEIFRRTLHLAPSPTPDERRVDWVSQGNVVGLARTYDGRVELFLSGPAVQPRSRIVRECVEHQTWHRTDGEPVDANRILLPGAGHFDQVAAFISTELLRNGADTDITGAFTRTEPIIELAIERLRLSDEALLGLAGELLLLEGLLSRAPDQHVGAVLSSWLGWRESRRDFELGTVGVEVKSTTRTVSAHHVQGVHQVEPEAGEEEALYLVSIGVLWVPPDHGDAYAIPDLVDSVRQRLSAAMAEPASADAIQTFLSRVREYGADIETGYDHHTMSASPVYRRRFVTRFCRSYDMTDPLVSVIRADDVSRKAHVEAGSVTFAVNLPDRINGDLNPTTGMRPVAEQILGAAGLL